MKTIQITIEEPLLDSLDRALSGKKRARSAFIRESIAAQLKRLRIKCLEEIEIEAYKKYPVQPAEFEVDPRDLAWGEDWKPFRKKRSRK